MYDKAKIRAAKLQIRQVLLEEWDPIGIRDEPLARDEYDSYLGHIHDLLARDASEHQIAKHLNQIETVSMGCSKRPIEKLLSVAHSLKRISLGAVEPAPARPSLTFPQREGEEQVQE